MNQLPLELVAMVYDHLLEYDLAPDPISEFTEQPNEKLVLHSWCEQVTVSWNTLTADTRSHVLTARLACRKLYHASNASFAKVLGDRKFRYTKTGIQDLQHFGLEDDLYLYIRTLTIGCSGFRILNDLHRVRDVVDDLDDKDRIRLLNAYEQCAEWQRDEHKSRYTTLAKILESFPNPSKIRMINQFTWVGGYRQRMQICFSVDTFYVRAGKERTKTNRGALIGNGASATNSQTCTVRIPLRRVL
jgi:hypothetical protein